jgi:hypothetical protein
MDNQNQIPLEARLQQSLSLHLEADDLQLQHVRDEDSAPGAMVSLPIS